MKRHIVVVLATLFACSPIEQKTIIEDSRILLLSGEVTHTSIILQSRFCRSDTLIDYDIPGLPALGRFQISIDSGFTQIPPSAWLEAHMANDFSISEKINDLRPSTRYYYRVQSLINQSTDTAYSSIGQFETLPTPDKPKPISFAISTGFNYEKFYGTDTGEGSASKGLPATGKDLILGFEAFEAVQGLNPTFFMANGDVVYYDKPGKQPELWATDLPSMRAKWHRYFSMPRNRRLCATTPVFYLKDDHDHRFNDCDTTDIKLSEPSNQLGIQVFKEQLPVTDPSDPSAVTYRTVRAGQLLQLWLVEGRDYRSPNASEDNSNKSIWGEPQKSWLKQSLLESNATFKLLISPTPMIGPDDAYKKDNHTNIGGFQSEQQEIFSWLIDQGFLDKNFYIVCGDRHWQYHSKHPNGLEEFSSGAFVNQNSRAGRLPGDPKSTDPEATITTPYIQVGSQVGGGFLLVTVKNEDSNASIDFSFRDTLGKERHRVTKHAH